VSDSSGTRATLVRLAGDGIGPEVVAAASRVLEAVAERFHHAFEFVDALIGGCAIDETGTALPAETLAACREADAVLLGAVGGPRWDDPSAAVRPEQGLLALRRELGVFANLRPVVPFPELAAASPIRAELLRGVDLLVVRELTGGIYFGEKRRENVGGRQRATDVCAYDEHEIERIVRVAAALARGRRGLLTSVDKANVLETSRLWRQVATRVVSSEYPDVQLEHALVDSCAMRLIQEPAHFDVIVTENMFGDILTDEAAVLAGSIGVLPSASLGDPAVSGVDTAVRPPARVFEVTDRDFKDAASVPGGARSGLRVVVRRRGLYEPIHGSAPALAGQDVANPIGTILSAAMLLRHSLGLDAEATCIEDAVRETVREGGLTPDIARSGERAGTTNGVTERVVRRVRAGSPMPGTTAARGGTARGGSGSV
jgi:3-isopropylmalate dehydrogenase